MPPNTVEGSEVMNLTSEVKLYKDREKYTALQGRLLYYVGPRTPYTNRIVHSYG